MTLLALCVLVLIGAMVVPGTGIAQHRSACLADML